MTGPAAPAHAATAFPILLGLFFVSGATALVYEVLWMRELQLVLGTSTLAVSALLACFMGGLGAGGFAIAQYADRIRRSLAVYGVLELGIGLYALAFPFLLQALTPAYLTASRAMDPSPGLFALIQFGLVTVLLLPPTAAMGATLPLLARFYTVKAASAGNRIGKLYAVNTIGAVVGIVLCGFVLLPGAGIQRTTLAAGAANILLGFAALALDRRVPEKWRPARERNQRVAVIRPVMIAVCLAIGLAGFAALVYEVAWTRLLALMLGSSTYSFSVMLIAFLSGIALGGKLGGRYADRLLEAGGWPRVLQRFALLEIGIALLSYAGMYIYPELPFWYVALFDRFGVEQRPGAVWAVSLTLAGVVMTLPAIFMGMHFPLAARAVVGYRRLLGKPVGIIYGVNAAGGAIGAFLAGFVLLPMLRVQATVFVAVTAGLLAAGILLFTAAGRARSRAVLLAPLLLAGLAFLFLAQRPPWNPLLMTAGMYHYAAKLGDRSREGILRYSVGLYDLLYYEEGVESVVTVAQNTGTRHRWLAVNGKVDASTTDDMPTQVLLSLLPMQFVEQPQDVLIIGLASGISAGAASLLPEVGNLEIVDVEPAMARAARHFDAWNHAVLTDPRVALVHNDGRNHLLLAEPGSYDVIVSEPSNPWISGVANLFTREFFGIGKSRLKPGGVWSQWVPIYGMDSRDLRSILKTFGEIYPHVLVYSTISHADLVLVGSDEPLQPTLRAAKRLFDNPAVAAELAGVGIGSATELLAMFLFDNEDIGRIGEGVPVNTDDNMYIEHSSARKLYTDFRKENFALLDRNARLPEAANAPEYWERLATSYRRRGDVERAIAAMSRSRAQSSGTDRNR